MTVALAILFALVAWWGSTAAIIYLDGLPRRTFKYSLAGMTLLTLVCLWGLAASAADTSLAGAYCAFACAIVAWGWHEMSFYTGFVTGPRKAACDRTRGGWSRFGQAVAAILWHELAILVMAAAIVALTWGGGNHIGVWTFLALWAMRQSAKLNVFLGVRNLHAELLPDHLRYLESYFTRKVVNPLFPVSVTLASVATALVATRALGAATPFARAGETMLATMLALAVLEHWMLVLPMPAMVLRALGIAAPGEAVSTEGGVVIGFAERAAARLPKRLAAAAAALAVVAAQAPDRSTMDHGMRAPVSA